MKYFSFPWPPVVAARDRKRHEYCAAAEVISSTKCVLIPSIELCLSDPVIPFRMCRRRLASKITFSVRIDKTQEQA
jgi:hypothetical protein